MGSLIPILIGSIIIMVSVCVFMMIGKKGISKDGSGTKQKSKAQIMREANKRLAKDPHDPVGLLPVADIYYQSQIWDKAYSAYSELSALAVQKTSIDMYLVNLRFGICALKLEKLPEAIPALTNAFKLDSTSYESNYYMGIAMMKSKQYEKAIPLFKKALTTDPNAEGVYLQLGQAMYQSKHFKESLPCFKKALDEDPSNKEALFCMADAMNESGNSDKAIKIFLHLRPDPVYGAKSSLEAGIFHTKIKDLNSAIQDYEIGLKHDNAPAEIRVELQYNLAKCYFEINQIGKGLMLLKSIRNINMNYKDVNALISRYQELSQNSNLQVYISSNSSDFVTLCRKFITTKYKNSTVKIQNIDVNVLYTDILAEIYSSKWEDVALFRFFRTTGSTGEIYIRDFHGHMSDLKAARGFCVSAGTYTEEARKYIEGRPLDLIEKNDLTKILKQITL